MRFAGLWQVSPHVEIDPRKPYHTSAVLGAALDVATSPMRFARGRLDEWQEAQGGSRVGGLAAGGLGEREG